MTSKSLVSGIIIFLNEEKFIQEAIESVFAQTYHHWELLLVDDGSTDGSTAIAQRYAEKYPEKVRYLEHENHQNRGMSATRNLGVCNAKGKYIAFLDADDVWLPLKLEQQVAILESQPEAAMMYGRTQFWYSWTGNPEDIQHDRYTELGIQPDTLVKPPTLIELFLQNEGTVASTCSVLIRREVFEIGLFEEDFRNQYEDMVFYSKVFLQVPVYVSDGCWDRYRQHPDNSVAIAIKTGQFHLLEPNPARENFLNWLEMYLSAQGTKNTKVWHLLQRELWPYRNPKLYRQLQLARQPIQQIKTVVKQIGLQTLPMPVYRWLEDKWQGRKYILPKGWVKFARPQRVTPLSRDFGFDRGLPIDRYYIEKFLADQVDDIQGRVLEIGDAFYTHKFGGDRVTKSEFLQIIEGNPEVAIIGDLTKTDFIPSDTFDCFILTWTMYRIYDVQLALKTIHQILKPGGVVLATFPGISQISNNQWANYWYWSFTSLSARQLFEEFFPTSNIKVETFGNGIAASGFVQGIAAAELRQEKLDYRDPDYEVLITVRAVKPQVTLL